MRLLGAGTLAAVVAWGASGCRDNPGFGLITTASQGETSASTGAPPETTSTGVDVSSSATSGPDVTSMVDPTTGDPPDPSTGTTAPPVDCGNGDLDPGEDCDDGNQIPGDGCEPGFCRPLFVQGFSAKFGDFCTAVVAGNFDNSEFDLAIGRSNDGNLQVLQNAGPTGFLDMAQKFKFEFPATAVVVQDIDHDGHDDLVALQGSGTVFYCHNDGSPDPDYCDQAAPIFPPDDQMFGTPLPDVLQVIDVTGDSFSDILIATTGKRIGYAPGIAGAFGDMQSIPLPNTITGTPNNIALFHIVEQSQNLDLVVTFNDMLGQVGIVPNFVINTQSLAGPFDTGASAHAVTVAQLGLGGPLPELLVLDQASKQLRVLSDDNSDYSAQNPGVQVGSSPLKLFAVPLRGPGKQDIVVLDMGDVNIPIVTVHAGKVSPTAYTLTTAVEAPLVGLTFADLDGDTDIDIAAIDGSCNLSVQINQTKL